MKLEVRYITHTTPHVRTVDRYSLNSDEEYAEVMGFNSLYDALLTSVKRADSVLGVFDEDLCVGIVGVETDMLGAHLWAHTSLFIRHKPELLLPVISGVLSLIEERYKDTPMYAIARADDHTVVSLAKHAGFTKDKVMHDLNGIKHFTAWR